MRRLRIPLVIAVLALTAGWIGIGYQHVRAARTFCGALTGPPIHDVEGCRRRLHRLGRSLSGRLPWELKSSEFGSTCPISGERYRGASGEDCLFCIHDGTNAPAYDPVRQVVSETALEPPPGTRAHAYWSLGLGTEAGYEAALRDLASARLDPLQARQLRSLALNSLNRSAEALQGLEKTPPDDLDVWALLNLGRRDEAWQMSETCGLGGRQALFQLSRDRELLECAGDEERWSFLVPLARREHGEAADAARRWLETHHYNQPDSPYAVLTCVAGALATRDARLLRTAQAALRQALSRCPRRWPFPLLRFYNGELAEPDVLTDPEGRGATLAVKRTESACFVGLYREATGQPEAARERYCQVVMPALDAARVCASRLEALGGSPP